VSVHEDISGTTRDAIFTNSLVHVAYGRGSVLLRRHCDTLCTSGFVDDYFNNGPLPHVLLRLLVSSFVLFSFLIYFIYFLAFPSIPILPE